MNWSCFFFQAEDGIRDTSVTGVQTCALPISDFGYFRPILFTIPDEYSHSIQELTRLFPSFDIGFHRSATDENHGCPRRHPSKVMHRGWAVARASVRTNARHREMNDSKRALRNGKARSAAH